MKSNEKNRELVNTISRTKSSEEFANFENENFEIEAAKPKTSNEQELSIFKLICFGIAGLPYQLMFSSISIFANKFIQYFF